MAGLVRLDIPAATPGMVMVAKPSCGMQALFTGLIKFPTTQGD